MEHSYKILLKVQTSVSRNIVSRVGVSIGIFWRYLPINFLFQKSQWLKIMISFRNENNDSELADEKKIAVLEKHANLGRYFRRKFVTKLKKLENILLEFFKARDESNLV